MISRSNGIHPFVGMDVPTLLERRVARSGDRPFLTWVPPEGGEQTWTYSEFALEVQAVASGLVGRGVTPGDRVLIHLVNCPEFMFAWFACAHVGAVAVTTNTRSAQDELSFFAEDCEAVGAVTQPQFADLVDRSAPNLQWLVCTDHDAGGVTGNGRRPDRASSFASLREDPNAAVRRVPDPLAAMSVQYTSGSTSRPKGVLWTHANALWGGQLSSSIEDLRPDDVHFVANPLFHTNALSYSMLASLWAGSSMVLVPKWTTSRFWDISVRHGCTWTCLVGFSYQAINDMEVPPDSSYRIMGVGGCDLETDARLRVKSLGWWGMTETVSLPLVGDPRLPNTPLSVGRPHPAYGIAVLRDDDSPAEVGEKGRLLVKGVPGVSLFAEYLNRPDVTADSFDSEGWFKTGDLATLLPDGHVMFEGREKDMLKVGAENVAALEVEHVIQAVPGVREAAVVGQPHRMLDEVPVAFVIGSSDQAQASTIIETCKSNLADFKVPRAVYFVDELPRVTLGKVDKVTLRRMAADRATEGTPATT